MKKILVSLSFILLGLILLSGCSGGGQTSSTGASTSEEPGLLSVSIDWPTSQKASAKYIPDTTSQITLNINNGEKQRTYTNPGSGGQVRETIELTPGNKQAEITAKNSSGTILAHRISTFVIQSRQPTSLTAILGVTIQDSGFTPQSITIPSGTTLMWVNNGSQTHRLSGSSPFNGTSISPGGNQPYTFNSAGTFNYSDGNLSGTVIVTGPPTLTANINPSTITQGQSATLSWETTNTTYVTISNISGQQAANNQVSVNPTETTTYTLVAHGPGGEISRTVTLTVTTTSPNPPPPQQVPMPVFSPPSGTYSSPRTIQVTCSTTLVTIRYTENSAQDPTEASPEWTDRTISSGTVTYKVRAFKTGMNQSEVATATYTITPSTDDHGNDFSTATLVMAGNNVPGEINPAGDVDFFKFTASINGSYTIETTGNTDTYGYLYDNNQNLLDQDDDDGVNSNFMITFELQAGNLYYIKVRDYFPTVTGAYTLVITPPEQPSDQVETPVFSPAQGTYTTPQTVQVTCSTNGATIRYTENSAQDPTESSPIWSNRTVSSGTVTYKVRAYKAGMTQSELATATYTITPPDTIMEFVTVPAGEFKMGSPDGEGDSDEQPQHTVYLDAYEIGKYEVTNAQFAAFVSASGYTAPCDWRNAYGSLTGYAADYLNNPVVGVTWDDAKAFCDYYGYRLPTEAEWEKAARGTDAREYPWGNTWDANLCNWYYGPTLPGMANFNGGRGTLPEGSFPSGVSPYGCMDMAGNVWEWCSDWYDANYYSISPNSNPQGPSIRSKHALRGGSFTFQEDAQRCADRAGGDIPATSYGYGFRVARSVSGPTPTLNSISITPSTIVIIAPGRTNQYTAIGNFNDGTQRLITTEVNWYCNNPYAGSINSSGLFTGAISISRTETANITASLGGKTSNQAPVTVTYTPPSPLPTIVPPPPTPPPLPY